MLGEVMPDISSADAAIGRLADDVEVALAAQDVRDAHAEQRVVVDDEDPDPVRGDAAAAALAAFGFGRHQLSSPGIGMPMAPGGMVIRTAVPRFGEDRTSNLCPDQLRALAHELQAEVPAPADGRFVGIEAPTVVADLDDPAGGVARHADADRPTAGHACVRSGGLPG